MTISKRMRKQILAHCQKIWEDDGIDPKEFAKMGRQARKTDRKAKQLARQVFETLQMVLAQCRNDTLQNLLVVSVDPAPDSSRMLVSVSPDSLEDIDDQQEIIALLTDRVGWLRSEIATSIHRKKVPNLTFRIVQQLQ